jgi:hypothetical protein
MLARCQIQLGHQAITISSTPSVRKIRRRSIFLSHLEMTLRPPDFTHKCTDKIKHYICTFK